MGLSAMGDASHEPTMEEILASIKKIIAEDGDAPARRAPRADPVPDAEDVLELTDAFEEDTLPVSGDAELTDETDEAEPILSGEAAEAGKAALAALSAMTELPSRQADAAVGSEALEALVREMLKPMLKDWLDANLPGIVERLVAREIARLRPRDG